MPPVDRPPAPRLLNSAGWTVPIPTEVRLEQSRPRYQAIADEVAKRYAKCKSIAAVAASMKTYEMIVSHALAFATTGEKPKWRPKKLRNRNPKRTGATKSYPYIVHAADVARLRDEEHWSFPRIAAKFGIGDKTARRAYDYAHPEHGQRAVDNGTFIQRGKYSHLGGTAHRKIHSLLTTT